MVTTGWLAPPAEPREFDVPMRPPETPGRSAGRLLLAGLAGAERGAGADLVDEVFDPAWAALAQVRHAATSTHRGRCRISLRRGLEVSIGVSNVDLKREGGSPCERSVDGREIVTNNPRAGVFCRGAPCSQTGFGCDSRERIQLCGQGVQWRGRYSISDTFPALKMTFRSL